MNVDDPNRATSGTSAATARALSMEGQVASTEDMHLAELLRSLRSLAAESPERQAKIEGLMRAYATGNLRTDAEATASAIIDDAIALRSRLR